MFILQKLKGSDFWFKMVDFSHGFFFFLPNPNEELQNEKISSNRKGVGERVIGK